TAADDSEQKLPRILSSVDSKVNAYFLISAHRLGLYPAGMPFTVTPNRGSFRWMLNDNVEDTYGSQADISESVIGMSALGQALPRKRHQKRHNGMSALGQ